MRGGGGSAGRARAGGEEFAERVNAAADLVSAGVPVAQPPRGLGHRNPRRHQISGGVDPLGELLATSARPARGATTTAHVTNVLRDMSRAPCDTPRSLHSAVAQRHLETEVANCVGGVISPLLANLFLHYA